MSRFNFCNCPAGFSAEPERHAPDCPGRSGAGKRPTPVPATLKPTDLATELKVTKQALQSLKGECSDLRTRMGSVEFVLNEWIDKSQWARKGAVADELGMHLADVIKKRYDQLQAELNARDQRIDRFEQVLQKVAKLRGTLDQHGMLEEVEGLLWPDLHSTPEERGTPEAEPCSGCGTPGWTGNCDKCIPY